MNEPIDTDIVSHSGSEHTERTAQKVPDLRMVAPNGKQMIIKHVGWLNTGIFPGAEANGKDSIALIMGDPDTGEGMMCLLDQDEAMMQGLSLQRLADPEYRKSIAKEHVQ